MSVVFPATLAVRTIDELSEPLEGTGLQTAEELEFSLSGTDLETLEKNKCTQAEIDQIALRVFALWLRTENKGRSVQMPVASVTQACMEFPDMFVPDIDAYELEDEYTEKLRDLGASEDQIDDYLQTNESYLQADFAAQLPSLYAKKMCGGCPIAQACLDASILRDEEFGVWGGWGRPARERMRDAFKNLRRAYTGRKATDEIRADLERRAAGVDPVLAASLSVAA